MRTGNDTGSDRAKLLRDVRMGAEELVRAYDMKAEIGMLCYVISVEAIHAFMDFHKLKAAFPRLGMILFALFITTMIAYMSVLFPLFKRNAVATTYKARNIFFLPEAGTSVDAYLKSIGEADLEQEAAIDIFKLTAIRQSKHKRFVAALTLTVAFYVLVLAVGLKV